MSLRLLPFVLSVLVQVATAAELPELVDVRSLAPAGAPVQTAAADTVFVLGGPGTLSGKFEDAGGQPDRQGWQGVDLTQRLTNHWNISTFNAANLDPNTPDNHAWWCGALFEPCHPDDPPEGSGDDWYDMLNWSAAVPDPAQDVTVRVRAVVNYNMDPANDFLFLQVLTDSTPIELESLTAIGSGFRVDVSHALTPADYLGAGQDEVRLRWLFVSDGAWSDEDCNWPSDGAAQIDSIVVTFDQGGGEVVMGTVETCEPGDPQNWQPTLPRGAGDFSKVWPLLEDLDPLVENDTPQFAFIDDGVVVPETGGTPCISWCYGPDGWIVNPDDGASELGDGVENEIWSPVLSVPPGSGDGALLAFDLYVHLDATAGAPYTFPTWRVRSTADPTGTDGWSEWQTDLLGIWGPPTYLRAEHNLSDLLVPDFTHLQIALGLKTYRYWGGLDGTPAPYFDNVAVKVFARTVGTVRRVQADGGGDYATIQAAVQAAAGGDTILLADGVYTGLGNRDISVLGKAVTITSESDDPSACVIDCEGSSDANHRGFHFNHGEGPDTVLRGVTVRNGYVAGSGGALSIRGTSPTVANCVFQNNYCAGINANAGAIYCDNASPTLTDCVFLDNEAEWGGAIAAPWDSQPVVSDCLFVGNRARSAGAGVLARYYQSVVTLRRCTFVAHFDEDYNGTLGAQFDAHLVVENCIVADAVRGSSVWCNQDGSVEITCSNFYGNTHGDWFGCVAGFLGVDGNIWADPLFCADQNPGDPYSLHLLSPCADTVCGRMGARPVACSDPTAVSDRAPANAMRLHPNSPNPFNPRTVLPFELGAAGPVRLKIYDVQGRLVRVLVDDYRPAGRHAVVWDGRDGEGRASASGAYLVRLSDRHQTVNRRIMLVR